MMPRLKQRAPDPVQVEIQTLIDQAMHRLGIRTKADAAKLSGMPASTFRWKYNEPDRFTVGELKMIFRGLKIEGGIEL